MSLAWGCFARCGPFTGEQLAAHPPDSVKEEVGDGGHAWGHGGPLDFSVEVVWGPSSEG